LTVDNDDGTITLPGGSTFGIDEGSVIIFDEETPLGYYIGFDNPFTDVTEGAWYYDDVAFVYTHGLFKGTSATTFSPEMAMTRAMLITVLARYSGVDTSFGETWYSEAVTWGVANGVTDGTNLDDNVTREQLATMLYRLVYPGRDGWGGEALAWVQAKGIMNDGRGGDNATRAEVAAMLHRFITVINGGEVPTAVVNGVASQLAYIDDKRKKDDEQDSEQV
jgi:hypothetical protein